MPSDLPRLVTRVPQDINDKFLAICDIETRTASNLLSIIIQDYIESYEETKGKLILDECGKYRIINKNKMGKSSSLKSG